MDILQRYNRFKKETRVGTVYSLVADFIKVFVVVYILTHVVFQQYEVEGSSMTPGLHTGDRLWIDRVSYHLREPARGEVIVLKYPNDITTNYVKRVIGLPGERVLIANGTVSIINADHPEGMRLDEEYVSAGNLTYLMGGLDSQIFTVPVDSYFVLGDNRMGSSDSRDWGLLPKADVIGRAAFRSYPINQAKVFEKYSY